MPTPFAQSRMRVPATEDGLPIAAANPLPVSVASGSGGVTEYTEDAAAAANPIGGALILVRRDTLTTAEVTTDGDNVALKGTSRGQAHVLDFDANAVLGTTAGAAVVTDANGTVQQYLRGIIVKLIAQLPATLGIKTAAASLSVAPASDAAFKQVGSASTLTSRSGTIAAGATAQDLAASNASRTGYMIQNQSNADLYFSTEATAVAGQPSFRLAAGQTYETGLVGFGTGAISIIGATTGQAFAAREW